MDVVFFNRHKIKKIKSYKTEIEIETYMTEEIEILAIINNRNRKKNF